jgi:hypothetical protein
VGAERCLHRSLFATKDTYGNSDGAKGGSEAVFTTVTAENCEEALSHKFGITIQSDSLRNCVENDWASTTCVANKVSDDYPIAVAKVDVRRRLFRSRAVSEMYQAHYDMSTASQELGLSSTRAHMQRVANGQNIDVRPTSYRKYGATHGYDSYALVDSVELNTGSQSEGCSTLVCPTSSVSRVGGCTRRRTATPAVSFLSNTISLVFV